MFILLGQAANNGAQGGFMGAFGGFLPLILIVVIFWLFILRPQQKKQKEIQNFRNTIAIGTEVVTLGGIYGIVRRIDEATNRLRIEVSKGVEIEVDRNAVNPSAQEANK